MKKTKEESSVTKENLSVEELAKFINESDEMKALPKKRLSFRLKLAISAVTFALLFVAFVIFIWKPYEFRLKFVPNSYDVYGYHFETIKNQMVFDGKKIDIGESIVDILPYTNYKDLSSKYILLLSDYGNIYRFNIDAETLYKYDMKNTKIASIKESALDIYDVVEAVTSDGTHCVIASNNLVLSSIDSLKIMDKLIYTYDDYNIYVKDEKLCICDYSKVSHFSMEEETVKEGTEKEKYFVDTNRDVIKYVDYAVKNVDNSLYIYGVTDDGKLTIYRLDLLGKEKTNIPEQILVDKIAFNRKIEEFDKEYDIDTAVRLVLENTQNTAEVYLDRFVFGSLSNDTALFTYATDPSRASNYIATQYEDVNLRYENTFYTIYYSNMIQCAFTGANGRLYKVQFELSKNGDIKYVVNEIYLDENETVDKIFYKDNDIYISIKETIENNYVVFENTTDIFYHEYLLKEFINK